MVEINLDKLGYVDVGKKLKAKLSINSEELLSKFPNLVDDLSSESIGFIKEAVDGGKEPKLKKREGEIREFFEKFKSFAGTMGFGADETAEMQESDELKSEQMDSGEVEYTDTDASEPGIETYDRETGEKEGRVVLGSAGNEGKLVPVKLEESLKIYLEHDGTPLADSEVETSGTFTVSNESSKDRLWDIDIALSNVDKTDLEEEKISLRELAPGTVEEKAYSVSADANSALKIEEFISALNDPETESYSLVLNAENEIYTSIVVKNIAAEKISNIEIKKIIPGAFEGIDIGATSLGSAEMGDVDDEKAVIWTIEELEPDAEAKIEINLNVTIEDKDTKVRSGKILADYTAPFSLSGMSIDKFDAYTNNNFYIIQEEQDEEPDKYDCQFVFENKSEFIVRLTNADVYDPQDADNKFIDIDPGEIPPLADGARWESKSWEYKTEEGMNPQFRKKVDFFVVADHMIETYGALDIADIELAVAAIEGTLSYNISRLPSFKTTKFYVTMKMENTGGADLNEVILMDNIQAGYIPPNVEDIVVSLNGNEIEISSDAIIIEPNDQESADSHKVSIELKNLRETDLEAFHPGDVVEVTYPITADKPARDTTFTSDVLYLANTYPAGKALEYAPEPIEIEVQHIRKRFYAGKEIIALASEGEYEITLYVVNNGKFALENYEIVDKIPENFEYYDATEDPEITSMEGMDVLKWTVESIGAGDRFEIRYKLKGEGKPSDAQETL